MHFPEVESPSILCISPPAALHCRCLSFFLFFPPKRGFDSTSGLTQKAKKQEKGNNEAEETSR